VSPTRLLLLAAAAACKVKDPPPITETWTDTFERDSIGGNYYVTDRDAYAATNGALNAKGAHNHPLWLRRKLPRNVRIELTCWSNDARGDIKVELFGDGHSYDPDGGGYLATSYGLIFGGWGNSKSIIARLDEHGKDVKARTDVKVAPKQKYKWKIERKGRVVRWWIDDMDKPFLELDDPRPLDGAGHEYFAINNWETDTWFDDLVITPL
jgi:hypothetical protein